jgi:hypothetical protein
VTGAVAAALRPLLAAALVLAALTGCGGGTLPSRPAPRVREAELWYASTPAPGVWVELKLVLENPDVLEGERTVFRFPARLLDDFSVRDAEPPLLGPPVQEADGRYAFAFPAPLDRSYNWYRLFLAARTVAPRPFQVAVAIEGRAAASAGGAAASGAARRLDVPPVAPRIRYVDREADPFRVVPEALVGWLPSQPGALLPLMTAMAAVLAITAGAGCLAAFWLQKR